ncbi:MAG: biotin/lipoyl-containing protein [Bacteroidia bacterium]|nr:biotin/lipoyl-containing protein [Bacteroidia bacterium]
MFEAIIEKLTLQMERKNGTITANDREFHPDTRQISENLWHVILGNRSYRVFIQKIDSENREVSLSINGKKTTVKLRSRTDRLLDSLGMGEAMKKKLESLKAPMPGLIHSILVKEGQPVHKGDPLFILEAMKMENIIKAPGEAAISKIHVKEKDSVEKNALLVTFG